MGGRIALHVALAAPARLTRLILVSSSAGIEDARERARRRAADRELATELERVPFDRFIERWSTQALFANDPPEVGALAREHQRRNDPYALAAVLRGLGSGEMSPLWSSLGDLTMPTTVLAGDRDAKYEALGQRMCECLPNATLTMLPGGHRLPLESPRDLAHELDRAAASSRRHAR
jgi:2-succinyl-6-hydroxy-2,4-cyclohexadiene-1-carboxylate synthase